MADEKKAVITFETIREIQRSERRTERLFGLDDGFYQKISKYLSRKGTNDDEIRNAKYALRDIVERRERKIMNLALSTVRTKDKANLSDMTQREKRLFDSLIETLNAYRVEVVGEEKKAEEAPEEEEAEEDQEETKFMKIEVLENLPEIVGADMENYGPFKKGEIVELPEDNALIFIDSGKAESCDSSS
ncbi:MAG: hypothetical protein ABIG20_01905 [archaeon]